MFLCSPRLMLSLSSSLSLLLTQTMNPFDGLSDDDIRTAICNANVTRLSLFVPEISFDLLVRRQITRLEQPGLQCIDLVFDELQRMASQCETTELTRFPELRDRVLEVVNQLLRKCVAPTQNMISNLIKIELAYINTRFGPCSCADLLFFLSCARLDPAGLGPSVHFLTPTSLVNMRALASSVIRISSVGAAQ